MTFLNTLPTEQRQVVQQEAMKAPELPEPGFFDGTGEAAAYGLGRATAALSSLAGEVEYQALSIFSRGADYLFDSDVTGYLDYSLRQAPMDVVAQMTPDPYTTGFLGNLIYGVVGVGVPAAVGGYFGGPAGAAITAGGAQGIGTFSDLTAQGVDQYTAAQAGILDGGLMAVGVGAPAGIAGRRALSTLVYGPGINVAQDLAASQGISQILSDSGYTELADRYAQIDAEQVAANVLLGGAFGYYGSRGTDAALVAKSVKHAEIDTAPGIPANAAALNNHVQALQSAQESLLRGERVQAAAEGEYVKPPVQEAFEKSGFFDLAKDIATLEAQLNMRGQRFDPAAFEFNPMAVVERDVAGVRVRELAGTRQAVNDALSTGNASDLISGIARQDISTDQRFLADKLAPLMDELGVKMIEAPEGSRDAGAYDNATNSIYMNQALPSVALHEALHGVTSALMSSKTNEPRVKAAVSEFETMLAEVRMKAGDMRDMSPNLRRIIEDPRGPLANIKELLTYGMTNKEFQSFLSKIEAPEGIKARNIWDGFKDAIAKLLEIFGARRRTMLDQVIESTGELVDYAAARPDVVREAQAEQAKRFGDKDPADRDYAIAQGVDPDITVMDETGAPTKAETLLREAEQSVKMAEQDSAAYEAAINCFLRG